MGRGYAMAVRRTMLACLLPVILSACGSGGTDVDDSAGAPAEQAVRPQLAIMSSLPIMWGEGGVSDILADRARPGAVRSLLEKRYRLVPIDTLEMLDKEDFLLLAQPRALSPDENLALDEWVRAGGHALVLADPMLLGESLYPLGDARAPQPAALLSPILARWGLEMEFDPEQESGRRLIHGDPALPVDMAGRFALTGKGYQAQCELTYRGIVANCVIGAGRVTLVADALIAQAADAAESEGDESGVESDTGATGEIAGKSLQIASRKALSGLMDGVFTGAE